MNFIFKKGNRDDWLYMWKTEAERGNKWKACLTSEGGVEADFIEVQTDDEWLAGTIPTLNARDQVVFIPNPIIIARNLRKATLIAELEALGLTADSVKLLVRS